MKLSLALLLLLLPSLHALNNGLGLTPPMGWNSWNCIGGNVNEQYVKDIALGLVKSGLAQKGYKYVNLDDGVMLANRSLQGDLQPDPAKFTNGSLCSLADYLHSLGLKFGVYSCGGTETCMGRAGSYGYEDRDAAQFAAWGVDYLKLDWCNSRDSAKHRYPIMRDALNKTGRSIFFKMCEWGNEDVWEWGAGVANSWRTWNDICNYWFTNHTENPYCSGVYDVIEQNEKYWSYAGPGGWNDPCYLIIGNEYVSKGGNFTMSWTQQQTQMSLWALMASPLILSSDVRNASGEHLRIIGNEEVIAINQDPLGEQGHVVARAGSGGVVRIWTKHLSGGRMAVGVYNYGNVSVESITVPWSQVGLGDVVDIRDVWRHSSQTEVRGGLKIAHLEAHETLLVICGNSTEQDKSKLVNAECSLGSCFAQLPALCGSVNTLNMTAARHLAQLCHQSSSDFPYAYPYDPANATNAQFKAVFESTAQHVPAGFAQALLKGSFESTWDDVNDCPVKKRGLDATPLWRQARFARRWAAHMYLLAAESTLDVSTRITADDYNVDVITSVLLNRTTAVGFSGFCGECGIWLAKVLNEIILPSEEAKAAPMFLANNYPGHPTSGGLTHVLNTVPLRIGGDLIFATYDAYFSYEFVHCSNKDLPVDLRWLLRSIVARNISDICVPVEDKRLYFPRLQLRANHDRGTSSVELTRTWEGWASLANQQTSFGAWVRRTLVMFQCPHDDEIGNMYYLLLVAGWGAPVPLELKNEVRSIVCSSSNPCRLAPKHLPLCQGLAAGSSEVNYV